MQHSPRDDGGDGQADTEVADRRRGRGVGPTARSTVTPPELERSRGVRVCGGAAPPGEDGDDQAAPSAPGAGKRGAEASRDRRRASGAERVAREGRGAV